MIIKSNISNDKNYGTKRSLIQIKYIVIHYTANDGDHDESNGNYFKNNVTGTSAHYFVDDDSATQSVPDNYIAYSVGKNYGKNNLFGVVTNANSISIELCDTNKNGVIYPTKSTIANAIELTRMLMKKYNIPQKNVVRHYDVCSKACPAYWCGSTKNDSLWLTEFWDKLDLPYIATGKYITSKEMWLYKTDKVADANRLPWKDCNIKDKCIEIDGFAKLKANQEITITDVVVKESTKRILGKLKKEPYPYVVLFQNEKYQVKQ